MDAKNWEWVESGGADVLWKFISLPVEKFQQVYGELSPGLTASEHQAYAEMFQSAWRATTDEDKERISQSITAIFERRTVELWKLWGQAADPAALDSWGGLPPYDDPGTRPAVVADFTTGAITVKPRTLLDWLAKWLLEYRDKLAICEREGCTTPYFVKSHARQRFCTPKCADSARQQKKGQWWAENRERFIKKWRQERKDAKRKNKGQPKQARAGRARRSEHRARPITKAT